MYIELGDTDEDKKFYKLAKVRERMACDVDQVTCIKDEDDKELVDEAHHRQR